MRNLRAALPLLFALPLLSTAAARAQEEPPATAPFGEQVEVTEVLLDVLVTDRDGNVIVGLKPEDFLVEENGEPIPLLDVSFYSNRPQLDAEGRRVEGPAGSATSSSSSTTSATSTPRSQGCSRASSTRAATPSTGSPRCSSTTGSRW